jgi:phage terminase small subunit
MTNISPINGTGEIAAEPDWATIYEDDLDLAAARENWRIVRQELAAAGTLSAANGHMMQRLVHARVLYGKCIREVASPGGIVTKPRRGNARAIARLTPHWAALREIGADADRIEAELGLSPRRRGNVTKVQKTQRATTAADAYLARRK